MVGLNVEVVEHEGAGNCVELGFLAGVKLGVDDGARVFGLLPCVDDGQYVGRAFESGEFVFSGAV